MTDAAGGRAASLQAALDASAARLPARERLVDARRVQLPLRFWHQQAHLTAPAEGDIARKAMRTGTSSMPRILERFGVSAGQLADRLELPTATIEQALAHPRPAPLVMLDAEDALAPTEAAAAQARRDAVEILGAPRDPDAPPSLRFYRPPGLALGTTAEELLPVLWGLAERRGDGPFPLDGVIVPKIEHPEEVAVIHAMLADAEAALGLETGSIRVAYLVEAGWAASQLPAIAQAAADRLCGLIFGLADYSADLGIPVIRNDHPIADAARAHIVSVAAGVGVPAIDGMTLDFPVADRSLDAAGNRERFLDRMALVYADAVRAREFGMSGKWVGHPAQLFAVLLAYDAGMTSETLEAEAAKLAAYRAAIHEAGVGATVIDGAMADRATDRHARELLRRAVAAGRFDAGRALELGVIDVDELDEAVALGRGGVAA